MGKGYKLTNATGDGPKTCAFFFSDKGCRNGANCKFSHDAAAASAPSASQYSVASSSVPSSESDSEGEIIESRAGAYASMANSVNPFFSSTAAVAVVAAPPPPPSTVAPVTTQKQPAAKAEKKRKTTSNNKSNPVVDGNPFLSFDKVEVASPAQPPVIIPVPNSSTTVVAPPPPKRIKQAVAPPIITTSNNNKQLHPTTNNSSSALPNFRNLQLPVASFHVPVIATSGLINVVTDASTTSRTPQHEPAPVPPPLPLPTATPSHMKWKLAVLATRGHTNYTNAFNFERSQQAEWSSGISTPSDWITSRPYDQTFASNPAAIAIDCEMCETTDPVSGKINPKALCRISIVNAENPNDVLLDTLVKPEWPITNYRTWINGITAENLNNVQFTLKHAQTFMNALCSEQTVIVGHAVHNDLFALQMVHQCVVDTAMLYSHADVNDGTPSLRNLAHGVLQAREMPEIHDSVNDARVALACAQHYLDKKGVVEPIEKVYSRSNSKRMNDGPGTTATLMVHRLPMGTQSNHIAEMFVAFTYITPKHVPEIEFSGKQGKCFVEFLTPEHAELAYNSLVGKEGEDKTGKKQKRVGMKSGGYVCVRKMRAEKNCTPTKQTSAQGE
ncbi:hypothetical protein ACHAWU_005179 [Discostella pseudostelligera]|uniref:C3H1-type domain-containing protein n=1 Tax=Discostella pseudostelligera TaxID=259834 RepID=A0ABD3MBS2_9STRA